MNTNCSRYSFFGADWVLFSVLYKQKLQFFPGCVSPGFVPQYVDFLHMWLTLYNKQKEYSCPSVKRFLLYILCVRLNTRFSCSFNCQTRDASIFQLYPFVLPRYVCKFLLLFSLADSMSFISGYICTQPRFHNVGFIDNLDSSQQKQFVVLRTSCATSFALFATSFFPLAMFQ